MKKSALAIVLTAGFLAGTVALAGEPAVELYPVVKDGKWGYMDKAGKEVIKPQYDCAWDFSEGLACVQVDLLRGYIDAKGEMVIKPQYFMARPFSEGLAAVYVDAQKWGNFMVFNRGSGHWIYIDKTGKEVLNPRPEVTAGAGEFHDGRARVNTGKKGDLQVLLRDGKIDRSAKGANGDLCDGLARVQVGKDKWGFADKDGKPAFEATFDDARDFSEGWAAVGINPDAAPPKRGQRPALKWGCIDKTGKMVVEAKYDFVGPLSEGLARVVVGGKHGFIDATGKVVIEPKFTLAWEFHNGLARVEVDGPSAGSALGKTGYINKTGAFVWQPTQ